MEARYWSFDGRISRSGYWRGVISINALAFSAFALIILLPISEQWKLVAFFPIVGSSMYRTLVLTAQRLHDLGQPMRVLWSPWEGFRWFWAMSFTAGEKRINAYGPSPTGGSSRSELVVLVGILVMAVAAFSGAGFECKASVSATGASSEEADARWSEEVERVHGRRFARSGIKLLSMTKCLNGSCSVSARPCALTKAPPHA